MIRNSFPDAQVNQAIVARRINAFLYAFHLVDGEIDVKFDRTVIVIEYVVRVMLYLPTPSLGFHLGLRLRS